MCEKMHNFGRGVGGRQKRERQLNLTSRTDCLFWAACLLLFFGSPRKSDALHGKQFDKNKQVCREDFVVGADGQLVVLVHWTKTSQFQESAVRITLRRMVIRM